MSEIYHQSAVEKQAGVEFQVIFKYQHCKSMESKIDAVRLIEFGHNGATTFQPGKDV